MEAQTGMYRRQLIYFSSYENRQKRKRAGYAAIFVRKELCEVQIYYRGGTGKGMGETIQPVYFFEDGSAVEGEELPLAEGMAVGSFETATDDFLCTGRNILSLEAIYLEGTEYGICGGRTDGQALFGEDLYSVTKWMDTVTEVMTQKEEEKKREQPEEPVREFSLAECMERLPELKLPFDGIRQPYVFYSR